MSPIRSEDMIYQFSYDLDLHLAWEALDFDEEGPTEEFKMLLGAIHQAVKPWGAKITPREVKVNVI